MGCWMLLSRSSEALEDRRNDGIPNSPLAYRGNTDILQYLVNKALL